MSSRLRWQVRAFHEKFGHPVADTPRELDSERMRQRLRLITEEYFELLEACGLGPHTSEVAIKDVLEYVSISVDVPDLVDALGDLDYVIEGTRVEMGIDGDPIAREIHRANMAKELVPFAHKPKKPDGWKPPDIVRLLRKQGWHGQRRAKVET